MKFEYSQDQPVNRDAVIATYSPEMTDVRDKLVKRLTDMRDKAKAMDVTGTLEPRVGFHTYDNGVTALDLGRFSKDFWEALAQHHTDEALGAMALDLDGINLPGADLIVILFDLDKAQTTDDQSLPKYEQPMIKIDWSKRNGDDSNTNNLSFYRDGYVETPSEIIRTERVHPPDASDFIRTYAEPSVEQETSVEATGTHPAQLEDLRNAESQVDSTLVSYGINLK